MQPNVREIFQVIGKAWHPIYNRHADSPPSWDEFHQHYGQFFASFNVLLNPKISDNKLRYRCTGFWHSSTVHKATLYAQ